MAALGTEGEKTQETGGATYVTATGQADSDDRASNHAIQVCRCNCLLPVISIDKRERKKLLTHDNLLTPLPLPIPMPTFPSHVPNLKLTSPLSSSTTHTFAHKGALPVPDPSIITRISSSDISVRPPVYCAPCPT